MVTLGVHATTSWGSDSENANFIFFSLLHSGGIERGPVWVIWADAAQWVNRALERPDARRSASRASAEMVRMGIEAIWAKRTTNGAAEYPGNALPG